MKTISIDIETYSSVNLAKCGVYKYAQAPDFEILLFAYSINHGPVVVVDVANGEQIPPHVLDALIDEQVTKWAFNASFERVCLSVFLGLEKGVYLDPISWRCTMIWSAYMGLPLSLEQVGKVLRLDEQKMGEGKDLIRYFCLPCKPAKTNNHRTRNQPRHDTYRWGLFKEYNARDVEVEKAINTRLTKYPLPEHVWEEYVLDQQINDRGIKIDKPFVNAAISINMQTRQCYVKELCELTGLENPNSVTQIRTWLKTHGVQTESLDKKTVNQLLKTADPKTAKVLVLRQKLAKSSTRKYEAMINAACDDDRCRGMFQFYGANRTGRWSGRLVQLQNLPRNTMKDLNQARTLVRQENIDALDLLYSDIPSVLSELVRTAFIPSKNMRFYVADFSAIEARVIAWLANEKWRIKAFQNGEDIYCMSATHMFGVLVEKHGVNSELRHKGKITELACGYGGSTGALKAMGALEMGIKEEELQSLVDAWRVANPNIVNLWWDIDAAVKNAIKQHSTTRTHGITIRYRNGMLFVILPSGRCLAYVKPEIGVNKFGSESVTYEGVGVSKKWGRIESYGPKFVENIVQAIARDLLAHAIDNLKHLNIVAHVHDEIIIEASTNTSLKQICETMSQVPNWAEGLNLNADGYVCDFYKKD